MGKTLYILCEEKEQEDFNTKAKYLFRSYFNSRCVVYLDSNEYDYLYLSMSSGVIYPNEEIGPYKVKELENDLKLWSLCVRQLIREYMKDKGLSDICLLYSGDRYKLLELYLISECKVISPIKYIMKSDMRNRWIDNLIMSRVEERLSIIEE
jgi:hypothetical protein